jgi:low affinity Fe/Cu permease
MRAVESIHHNVLVISTALRAGTQNPRIAAAMAILLTMQRTASWSHSCLSPCLVGHCRRQWTDHGPCHQTRALFHYSDTWQLVINTGTSVVTFLMVFLIQNTQNRDSKAMQLKLDELLKGVEGARTGLVNLESMSDKELLALEQEFQRLAKHRRLDE